MTHASLDEAPPFSIWFLWIYTKGKRSTISSSFSSSSTSVVYPFNRRISARSFRFVASLFRPDRNSIILRFDWYIFTSNNTLVRNKDLIMFLKQKNTNMIAAYTISSKIAMQTKATEFSLSGFVSRSFLMLNSGLFRPQTMNCMNIPRLIKNPNIFVHGMLSISDPETIICSTRQNVMSISMWRTE